METWIAFILVGIVGGLLAGLLGAGIGLVTVPMLALILPHLGITDNVVMKVAITTSQMIIIVTIMTSVIAYHRSKMIYWNIFYALAVGCLIGAVIGAIIAHLLPGKVLRIFFGCFAITMALRMMLNVWRSSRIKVKLDEGMRVPKHWVLALCGFLIGNISSMLGIGGGTFNVPLLHHFRVPIRNAIATSSTCSLVVSVTSALSLWLASRHATDLPPHSSGYIYWPAFIGIAISGVIFAAVGTKLAQYLSTEMLAKIFAVAVLLAGLKMLF